MNVAYGRSSTRPHERAVTPAAGGRTGRSRSNAPGLGMGRITSLMLTLLIVIGGTSTYGLFSVLRGCPPGQQFIAWCASGMLVVLAIVILLLGRFGLQRSMQHIEEQLHRLRAEDRLDPVEVPVPRELQRVMSALTDYVDGVRNRVDLLRIQKKELDIQMRMADMEKRNTEAIIYSIWDAVLVVDTHGELVLSNPAAERLFGFKLSECRCRPIERVLHDHDLVALIKDARTADHHSIRRQVEYSAVRGGSTQTFDITLSTIFNADGELRGIVAVFHDITREREIAQIKTDFVSAVSHELRTPLSSIKAYVEMLLDGEAHDDDTRDRFYQIIEAETDRLQRLINNILNISRIESGVVEIHKETLQVTGIIREVVEMMMPQAREKQITLTGSAEDHLPLILADRDLLHQAVLNVVGNAVKYTQEGGQVQVHATMDRDHDRLAITVTDTGMGIRAQDVSRIFDKFYRTREGMAAAKGTGLGLSLVKQIVEKVHDGEISVRSELGMGTMVVLRFPILASTGQAAAVETGHWLDVEE